jgi:tetratricopeptide (TPR) repeat protein
MLFDLRSRGRRGTVRVVYIGLAVLIGLGLVGFGIGGGFGGGGILSAGTGEGGSNSASFANQIKHYRKITVQQPSNPAGWEGLAKALLHEAGGVTQNGLNDKGKELFHEASDAWTKYLALSPAKPNSELAQLMVTVYGEEGLNQPQQAVAALQIVVAARPKSAAYWALLAQYSYKARNTRQGDLAASKAVALSPANQRARVKSELAEVKNDPFNEKTYTTTTNGKTYAVKKAPNGTFTGTEIQKAPAPATTPKTTPTTAKK